MPGKRVSPKGKAHEERVYGYVKESNIPGAGKGLFALHDIKKGQVIAQFKGIVHSPDSIDRKIDPRSTIYFSDGSVLVSSEKDIASYANDPIVFDCDPANIRPLFPALKSTEPFYKMHPGTRINAVLKNTFQRDKHKAYIVADSDIVKDEEIFVHYGFNYWFVYEFKERGFLPDADMISGEFSDNMTDYPAYIACLNLFYPENTSITKVDHKGERFYNINFAGSGGSSVTMKGPNLREMIWIKYPFIKNMQMAEKEKKTTKEVCRIEEM